MSVENNRTQIEVKYNTYGSMMIEIKYSHTSDANNKRGINNIKRTNITPDVMAYFPVINYNDTGNEDDKMEYTTWLVQINNILLKGERNRRLNPNEKPSEMENINVTKSSKWETLRDDSVDNIVGEIQVTHKTLLDLWKVLDEFKDPLESQTEYTRET